MPGFMISCVPFLLVANDHATPLGTHHDLVLGQLEVEHIDFFLVTTGCQQSRFVYEILQVRAGKPGRGSRQHADVHILRQRHLSNVHLQDTLSPLDVRSWYHNMPIEPSWTEQCGIYDIRPVGCSDENDPIVGLESI